MNPQTKPAQPEEFPELRCDLHDVDLLEGENGMYCHFCRMAAQRRRDEEAQETVRAQELVQERMADIERRLGTACIPARYRELSFDTYPGVTAEAKLAANTLRRYANTFRESRKQGISALLLGGAGTGKTGLALCVANAIVRDHNMTAVYMKAYGAVRHQRDTWGRKGRTEREALDDLVLPDLLILDEVGTNIGTPAEMQMLFEVLDERYGEKRPTILISNLPMKNYGPAGEHQGLRAFLGPRLIDRFNDDGSFNLLFDWPSLRGSTANAESQAVRR
ncbi:MAG: ATP-binding protein [Pseudoxanthomonas sp.]